MSYLSHLGVHGYNGIQHIVCCVFCLVCPCLVYSMLPVSLSCPFWIVLRFSLTFINNYLQIFVIVRRSPYDVLIYLSFWFLGDQTV